MPSQDGEWCEVQSAFGEIVWFGGKTISAVRRTVAGGQRRCGPPFSTDDD
jgi:hypothetical protein